MREEFNLDPGLIYLNSANQSLLPSAVRDAIARYTAQYERNPTAGLNLAWGQLWETQVKLAAFLGAEAVDLFLRTNVTAVLNTFLLGIPLPVGSEILVGELEYGAIVNVCRMRAARDGLRLRVLKMPASPVSLRRLTPEALLDRILSQLGPDTRLVLLSHVVSAIGLVLPVAQIARETHRRGIYLVVDGAYAPGALPVDLSELGEIDFYGCSLYKWMLGPKGTAFGWVKREHQSRLRPLHAGWTTFDTFGPFSAFGGGSRFQEAFLMSGCHDFAPFRAVVDTLDFRARWGEEAIRARMRHLQETLHGAVASELGWWRLAPEEPGLRGPLLAYRLPGRHQEAGKWALARILEEAKVQIGTFWLRGQWNVVFSPHIHNSEEEILQAVRRLKALYP
jgi:isopenicillin-N epimerase